MKNTIILVFLVCNVALSQAQNRFSAGIIFGPQLSTMRITNPSPSLKSSGIKESGAAILSYFVGAQLEFKIHHDFFIRSGLNYKNAMHQYRASDLVFATDLLDQTKSTYVNNFKISSIDVPVDFGYRTGTYREKINIVIGVGGIAHFILNTSSVVAIIQAGTDEEVQPQIASEGRRVTPAPYSAVFFGGVEYQISKHFGLAIEPFMKYTPNKFDVFYAQSKAKTGMETGLTCRLRFM